MKRILLNKLFLRGLALALTLVPAGLFAQTARELRIGSWVSGTVNNGSEDWFTLRTPEDGILRVESAGTTDTCLEIYDSGGTLVEEDDDGGADSNARLELFAAGGSAWRIKLRGYDRNVSGPYRLLASFEALPPDTARNTDRSRAVPLSPGETAGSYLRIASESRWFRVTIPAGGGMLVASTQGNLDTVLCLYNAQGNLLAENDDYGDGSNSRIGMWLQGGTVYLEVKEYEGRRGAFSIAVEIREPPQPDRYENDNTIAAAKDIEIGTSQERNFTNASDIDFARLRITQTAVYEIRCTSEDGALDTYLELFDSNGESIAEDDDGGGGLNALIKRQLTPGTYYIKASTIDSDPLEDNRYSLSVIRQSR